MKSVNFHFIQSLHFTSTHLRELRKIGEYRGGQGALSRRWSKETLLTLKEHALIESVESSNRLEQITAPRKRIQNLVIKKATPQNRSEQDIAGYREALCLIHESYEHMEISVNIIKQIHSLIYSYFSEKGGDFKMSDNKIIESDKKGGERERFVALSAIKTPQAMEDLCQNYNDLLKNRGVDPLILFPLLVLDFLCIHPFRDDNGRCSRLITLLVLYQNGYDVGKYISLERVFEESKETYYSTLEKSSQNWHQGKHNPLPWIEYFWGVIIKAYKELEEKIKAIKEDRHRASPKTAQIKLAIEKKLEEFSISDIEQDCPNVSRDMIRNVLRSLRDDQKIQSTGVGRNSKWRKV